ncbi:ABC transporter permease [Aliikangiella marina]|uniref:ABC transporter permease n=1 Tax=Aliikangiella marina TaxID=1712262 RepID=A0A545TCN0_9GAMM|nr:ABC transporter permease [Aliikangiella marina]TQV74978.1 ABC transporter permease [Aliikangiella marina]
MSAQQLNQNSQSRFGRSMSLILPLAWRNLWRNKRRSLLTMLAIFVAVMSMVVLGAFMRAWSSATIVETINNLTGHGQIHALQYLDDPNIDYRIKAIPGSIANHLNSAEVTHRADRVRVPAMIRSERENSPVELLGIQPAQEKGLSFISEAIIDGRYLESNADKGIILGKKLADRLQTKLGRRVVLMSQHQDGSISERGYRVVGIFTSQPGIEKFNVFISIQSAQALLGIGSDISEVTFKLQSREQIAGFVQRLRNENSELDIQAWDELQPFTKAMIEMSDGSILIWILVSFTVVSFGLINTLLMAVFERMREFGLFQALGMKTRWLLLQILFESTFMMAVATAAGLIAGILIVIAFEGGLDLGVGASYFGAAQVVYPELDWSEVSYIGVLVMFLGVLASLYPAIKAARNVPVDVLSRATN